MPKTYDQFCPIARGLDLLGERWTLLVLRELSIDDQRFNDLRRTLKGIAPNLLADRLRRLQEDGLVEQAELPPPAARTVYRLTAEGRDVVPVIGALGRFGARYLPEEPDPDVPARRTLVALLGPWSRRGTTHAGPSPALVVEVDGQRHRVQVGDRRTEVRLLADDEPSPPVLRFSTRSLADARRTGGPLLAEVLDEAAADAFASTFALELEPTGT